MRLLLATTLVLLAGQAQAQVEHRAQARYRAEAYLGEPYGVGRVEVNLPPQLFPGPLGPGGLRLEERERRLFYPAADQRRLPPVIRDVLGQSQRPALRILNEILDRPRPTTVYFLFKGQAPLNITVLSSQGESFQIQPAANPQAHHRLLAQWWRLYSAEPGFLQAPADYPPVVDNYLRTMLGRRLGIAASARRPPASFDEQFAEELGLTTGTEDHRLALERERFTQPARHGAADRPLPEPAAPPAEFAEPPEAKVEPLATRVPVECFYVRFGSFKNFLWFQDTLELWGGDAQNLIKQRGLDYGTREHFETQLATELTTMARMMGDLVIADVAIVGTDFLRDGPSYGLMFQARNPMLLTANLGQERKARLKRIEGLRELTVRIAGHDVSLLTTPDGSVRSYYVPDGEFHFITNSQTLARRFLETGGGKGSLGQSREFRHARAAMPPDRDDTVFAYLSSAFFQNLVSPAYRIEMARRLEAAADIELVELAMLASAAEGQPGDTIDQLVAGGFLPAGFGPRADGSRAEIIGGTVRDSRRGQRGYFTPAADVPVAAASEAEIARYGRFVRFYRQNWGRLDPILMGMKRTPGEGGLEHVAIDLRMSPLARANYDRLSQMVGPAGRQRLAAIPADALAGEVILADGHRVFAGIQAFAPWLGEGNSVSILDRLRSLVVGYLGTTGRGGPVEQLQSFLGASPPDAAGYSVGRLGLWRRQLGEVAVYSFQREVLDAISPQLRWEETSRPAQAWFRAADLSQARLAPALNSLGYSRTRETSLGNLRLMQQVMTQFHVPADDARAAAEAILGARLIDPLGGEYQLTKSQGGVPYWTSTSLATPREPGQAAMPAGYQAPPLNWFRGMNLEALLEPGVLTMHIDLDMQMPRK